jgi:hypothetical protein
MPVDSAPIDARQGTPGDPRHPVTDRDQRYPTVSAVAQANTGDLAKRHVDHATHPQPVLARSTVFRHAGLLQTSGGAYKHYLMISHFFAQFISKNGDDRWLVSTPKSHHYARR